MTLLSSIVASLLGTHGLTRAKLIVEMAFPTLVNTQLEAQHFQTYGLCLAARAASYMEIFLSAKRGRFCKTLCAFAGGIFPI